VPVVGRLVTDCHCFCRGTSPVLAEPNDHQKTQIMKIETDNKAEIHVLTAENEEENNVICSIHACVSACEGIPDGVANNAGYRAAGRNYCSVPFGVAGAQQEPS
jgi:hypothetical protein